LEPAVSHEYEHESEFHFTQEFWDERYGSTDRLWSGQPNEQLVAQVAGLPAGQALEAGCGEGADAIWLAANGWTVTAVDVSAVALDRAGDHAAARGEVIASRITWQREDLLTWAPDRARYDLVSAHFLHLPQSEMQALHLRLAAGVRPGGTLLVVVHHVDDLLANVGRCGPSRSFPSAAEVAAPFDADGWEILVADALRRDVTDVDGRPAAVKDTVVRAVRLR
jgi:SAM-dependent methyltransferase